MYVPPYQSLLRNLGINKDPGAGKSSVTIPLDLLKFLLQIAVANSGFDEEAYFKENPDVRDAVRRGDIESGYVHYIGFGYFEGRKGGTSIDENWYLSSYPDVDAAVRSGQVQSASHHFYTVGGGEGRSPNAEFERDASRWKNALSTE